MEKNFTDLTPLERFLLEIALAVAEVAEIFSHDKNFFATEEAS